MKVFNKCDIAENLKVTLKNCLEELVKNREFHIENKNKQSIELYDMMIDNTLDNINKMNRIINTESDKNKQ